MQIPEPLVEQLRKVRSITVLTGAGVSAESGVPTFRDAQTGLWSRFKPEELATPEAFLRNPKLVWEWYAFRRQRVHQVQPNPGHLALVALEQACHRFTLITQNVDGLHQRAGSRKVIELHGNITRVKCFDQHHPAAQWDEVSSIPPRCAICGSLLRPDVVWFGENLPLEALEAAEQASAHSEVFLSIGTSSVVYPAAGLPMRALDCGAVLVEINLDETPLTDKADYYLKGPSGVVLPAVVESVWPGHFVAHQGLSGGSQ